MKCGNSRPTPPGIYFLNFFRGLHPFWDNSSAPIINDAFSRRVWARFLSVLDKDKGIFLREDIRCLQPYATDIDEEMHAPSTVFFDTAIALYKVRLSEAMGVYSRLLDLYPATFFKQTLPWRILLGSQIDSLSPVYDPYPYDPATFDTIYNISTTTVCGSHQKTFCQVDSVLPLLSSAQKCGGKRLVEPRKLAAGHQQRDVTKAPCFRLCYRLFDSFLDYISINKKWYI